MTEHNGLPVAGYKPQSNGNIAVVNYNKELEERVLRQIDAMERANSNCRANSEIAPYDPRMMALAKTGIQEAFMWLNRAVFQPGRIALPEDTN